MRFWHTGKAGTDPLGAQTMAFSDSFDQSFFYISLSHFQVSSVCVTVGDSLPQEFLIGKFHLMFFPYMELPAESVTTVTLPIYRSIQKVIGAQHKPTNHTALARPLPYKALVLQRRVEIGCGTGILAALRAILTVCRIKRPRLFG